MRLYLHVSDGKPVNDPDTVEVDPESAPGPEVDLATGKFDFCAKDVTIIAQLGDFVSLGEKGWCFSSPQNILKKINYQCTSIFSFHFISMPHNWRF